MSCEGTRGELEFEMRRQGRGRETYETEENGKVAAVPVRIPHDLLPERLERHGERLVRLMLDLGERGGRKERLVRRLSDGGLSDFADEAVDFAANVGGDVELKRGRSREESVDGGGEGGTEGDDLGGRTLGGRVLIVDLLVFGEPEVEVSAETRKESVRSGREGRESRPTGFQHSSRGKRRNLRNP